MGNEDDLSVCVGDDGTNPRGSGPSAAQDLNVLSGEILRITTAFSALCVELNFRWLSPESGAPIAIRQPEFRT